LIPSLGRVAKIEQGVALAHSSSIWHAGHPISGGTRVILVCFLVSTAHAEHMRRFQVLPLAPSRRDTAPMPLGGCCMRSEAGAALAAPAIAAALTDCRRRQERAARLRNEGMLMPAKAAIRMATAVLSEHGYGEDVIHQRMSGCGMPPPHDKVRLPPRPSALALAPPPSALVPRRARCLASSPQVLRRPHSSALPRLPLPLPPPLLVRAGSWFVPACRWRCTRWSTSLS
jgi:hypothetical protein